MSVHDAETRLLGLLERALAAGLLGVLAVIILLVALRYGFSSGIVGANEAATTAFVYLSSVGSAVAVGKGEHIRVTLLAERLDAQGRLIREACSVAAVGSLNAVIAAASVPWIAATGSFPMPATQLPRFVAQAAVPLGCGLAALFCGTRLLALLRRDPPC